jgi:DNA-binding transcriptional MerR regulator
MRSREFLPETSFQALGVYDPADDELHRREIGDTRKTEITLKDINRLKRIRKARKKELDKKRQFLPVMYGDPDAEQKKKEQELEQLQHELKMLQDEMMLKIDKAEVDQKQKAHIKNLALNAVGREKKK